jgi:hypothetical protein
MNATHLSTLLPTTVLPKFYEAPSTSLSFRSYSIHRIDLIDSTIHLQISIIIHSHTAITIILHYHLNLIFLNLTHNFQANRLETAVRAGDIDNVRACIEAGDDVNFCEVGDMSPNILQLITPFTIFMLHKQRVKLRVSSFIIPFFHEGCFA